MKKHGVFALIASSVMVFGLGACAVPGDSRGSSSSSSQASAGDFSLQDLMFAAMMIPHHEQAVEMGNIALQSSSDPAVLDLARRIVDGQDVEIIQMAGWLEDSSWDATNPGMDHSTMDHGMHGGSGMMSGMATDADLARLATLTSPDFDRLFLQLMIDHHEGALSMVTMINNSANSEVRELGSAIVIAQKAEIAEMTLLLESLGR